MIKSLSKGNKRHDACGCEELSHMLAREEQCMCKSRTSGLSSKLENL